MDNTSSSSTQKDRDEVTEWEMKQPGFTFIVSQDQFDKYQKWIIEQNKKAIKIQKKKIKKTDDQYEIYKSFGWDMGYPYCGAVGGEIDWIFTPNGIGDCCVVRHHITGDELNLTDYSTW
jgi:hypothetical protein